MNIHALIEIIEANPAIYRILKSCPYQILKQWEVIDFAKGCVIGRQGQPYDYFCIIVSGLADIYVMAENGKRYSQAIYTAGNYIGELEIFERKPFSCFVEALTNIKIIRIHRLAFLEWLDLDKNASGYLFRTLCDQFYSLSQKAGADTLYSLKQRLSRCLLDAKREGVEHAEGSEIRLNKEALGEQLAVTGRSVNRVLQYLKEKGIIVITSNRIFIKDEARLAAEANQSS